MSAYAGPTNWWINGTNTGRTHSSTKLINQSGLVLNLDAGVSSSYPGSGNTWTDLSGNGNNGTLTNGPTFSSNNGGYFSFDGVNDHVAFSYTQPSYGISTSFSWNVWVYTLSFSDSPLLGNRGTDLDFTKLTTKQFEYYSLIVHDNTIFGNATTLNVWQNMCIVKNGTNFTLYKNAVSIATGTSSITKPSKPFYVGGDPTASEYASARISNIGIYNRALSATEISQNFNALRGRYGI